MAAIAGMLRRALFVLLQFHGNIFGQLVDSRRWISFLPVAMCERSGMLVIAQKAV